MGEGIECIQDVGRELYWKMAAWRLRRWDDNIKVVLRKLNFEERQ
jgi:hypothetical protein